MAKRAPVSSLTGTSGHAAAAVPLPVLTNDLQERIRERAYELFLARGCEHGHDREDWIQAEAEVLGTDPRLAA